MEARVGGVLVCTAVCWCVLVCTAVYLHVSGSWLFCGGWLCSIVTLPSALHADAQSMHMHNISMHAWDGTLHFCVMHAINSSYRMPSSIDGLLWGPGTL